MAKKTTEPAVEDTKIEEIEPATICCGEEFFDKFKEVLSAEEAAQYLGIGKATIKALVADDEIPYKRVNEHKIIFSRRALENWVFAGNED